MVRHMVGADNVSPEGIVVNPELVRHGVIQGGHVAGLSGPIDPSTHLNLDFPSHRADLCVVATELKVGSPVEWDEDGLRFATVAATAYKHLGPVRVDARRLQWLQTLQERREGEVG